MMTKNVHVREFSALSKAVHVMVDVPKIKDDPLGGVQDAFRMPEPSVAVELIE